MIKKTLLPESVLAETLDVFELSKLGHPTVHLMVVKKDFEKSLGLPAMVACLDPEIVIMEDKTRPKQKVMFDMTFSELISLPCENVTTHD